MDFYEISSKTVASLTRNERILFDYVVKNMNLIKNQSIREVSAECFVFNNNIFALCKKAWIYWL